MTLSSLSIYVIFVDPHQRNKDVMPFSLPTTKAYVEFIGREKARAYLQSICCKVKQWIQRELSHIIKSRCACVSHPFLRTKIRCIIDSCAPQEMVAHISRQIT
jgi:hypothetical protein